MEGRVGIADAYVRAFMEIDAILSEKKACVASRLHFVSAKFLYGKPLKEARAAAARGGHSASSNTVSLSPLDLMTASPVCCQKDCLGGNLIAGVDATEYWMDRAANARTQLAKQVMIREFHLQFPGICRNAAQTVLGVSRDSITKARARPSEPPPHGLLAHYEANPRPLTFKQERLASFFPDIHRGMSNQSFSLGAHQLCDSRQRSQRFMEVLQSNESNCRCSAFDVHVESFEVLGKGGLRGSTRAHADHNVCPSCRSSSTKKDALILQRSMLRDDRECANDRATLESAYNTFKRWRNAW